MFYYYNADEEERKTKNIKRLLSKIDTIEKVQENEPNIHLMLCVISTIAVFVIFQKLDIYTKWYMNALIGIAFGGLINSIYLIPFKGYETYRKLSKGLKSPLFVKEMCLSKQTDEIEGMNFPSLNISYEVNNPSDNAVVLLCESLPEYGAIDKNGNRRKVIITAFDTSKVGKGNLKISSEILGKAISKLGRTNELIVLKACQLNKSVDGDFVKDDDINKKFFSFESFYFDFDYGDEEGEG